MTNLTTADKPLSQSGMGREVVFGDGGGRTFASLAVAQPDWLTHSLDEARGLLLVRGLSEISVEPPLLVDLSRLFGLEVEDYRRTLTAKHQVHPEILEIFVVSNAPPASRMPPPQPDPPRLANGGLPVQFPHRRGSHTDQSYRRPPPDVSLFYCVEPAPIDQAQTLYADGIGAYQGLPPELKARVDGLVGIHAQPGIGRGENAVRAGEAPKQLEPNQLPQRQPVVRSHPVTGEKALYLCEAGQMDWIDGPFDGMEPGLDGDGAKLLYELMSHYTQPQFVYVHEWQQGDLIIYDNRSTIHAATWFEEEQHDRGMWRTTIHGNPGTEYAGEAPSWIPASG